VALRTGRRHRTGVVLGHAVASRHDLPAPLYYFVRERPPRWSCHSWWLRLFAWKRPRVEPVPRSLHHFPRTAAGGDEMGPAPPVVSAFAIIVAAALWGTGNPMMNLARRWLDFLVGRALLQSRMFGNFWPVLDPGERCTGHRCACAFSGPAQGASLGSLARGLDTWPASCCSSPGARARSFSAWPRHLIASGLRYCLDSGNARRDGLLRPRDLADACDVFAIYSKTLGRFAPLASAGDGLQPATAAFRQCADRNPDWINGYDGVHSRHAGRCLFDGLLAGEGWSNLEPALRSRFRT